MGTSDGAILGATKIVDAGPPTSRWNVVILSEGYQESEMTLFASDAQKFADTLLSSAPFDRLRAAINIFRVDVTSKESGARDPKSCPFGTGAKPKTYFDASFCNGGLRRLLMANNGRILNVAHKFVPKAHFVLLAVNSTVAGGSGGNPAIFSRSSGEVNTALHEMGHSVFKLADEYQYYLNCREKGRDTYSDGEPSQPNITTKKTRADLNKKWGAMINPATPVPTTQIVDCTKCDEPPSPVPAGTIGLFEGAHNHHCRIYRPAFDCRMRNVQQPFCGVCQAVIETQLKPFLPT